METQTVYTGANISLMMGSTILDDVFGISWEVNTSKRPIYGYNSQYWDVVAKGQTIVTGTLITYVNNPTYLSKTINRAFNNDTPYRSPPFDPFDNKHFETAEKSEGMSLNFLQRRDPQYWNARPDQYSDHQGLSDSLDVVVIYGDVNNGNSNDFRLNYQESYGIKIENIHFLGESQEISVNDQPLLQAHNFIARNKTDINENKIFSSPIREGNNFAGVNTAINKAANATHASINAARRVDFALASDNINSLDSYESRIYQQNVAFQLATEQGYPRYPENLENASRQHWNKPLLYNVNSPLYEYEHAHDYDSTLFLERKRQEGPLYDFNLYSIIRKLEQQE